MLARNQTHRAGGAIHEQALRLPHGNTLAEEYRYAPWPQERRLLARRAALKTIYQSLRRLLHMIMQPLEVLSGGGLRALGQFAGSSRQSAKHIAQARCLRRRFMRRDGILAAGTGGVLILKRGSQPWPQVRPPLAHHLRHLRGIVGRVLTMLMRDTVAA